MTLPEYTELTVRIKQLVNKYEDIMLNDRDIARAADVASELVMVTIDLKGITRPMGSLALPYWTPRLVDANTTGDSNQNT